eukprot:TRINITY_DN10598_c0_g1_i1.p1 TRINITY_DN10598_c0_g1~~TRINITY_DN10598_c0_g1_i1.p1  ORF type:complete len:473 (+),score=138.14 TRINITY_DN10598_c0_g1_i1:101-1519(+)
MKRLCGLDVDRLDRFSMVVREDIALDTFGQEEDLDDTKGDFMIPRKVERRGKPRIKLSPSEDPLCSLSDSELNLKLSHTILDTSHNSLDTSHTSLDTSPFSNTSFDSAIGDVYCSVPSLDMHRSESDFPDRPKIIIESLLSDAPYESVDQQPCFFSSVKSCTSPRNPLPHPGPADTPPSLRQQRRKYQEHHKLSQARDDRLRRSPYRTGQEPPLSLHRQEIEHLCVSLVSNYQHGLALFPPANPATCMAESVDPLLVATRLLTDSLSRLRVFLSGLETFNLLSVSDRNTLYGQNVCCLTILKASIGLDLSGCPVAFPLPYGENLGETEALHLITAHELYNELRSVMASIQALGIRELPVMLLIMMVAFFQPLDRVGKASSYRLEQPEKVANIQHFYRDKIQVYLDLRFGPTGAWPVLHNIYQTIDRVKLFSGKLKGFLDEVTSVGLQAQYEAVTENLGLIAYLIQWEQSCDT